MTKDEAIYKLTKMRAEVQEMRTVLFSYHYNHLMDGLQQALTTVTILKLEEAHGQAKESSTNNL